MNKFLLTLFISLLLVHTAYSVKEQNFNNYSSLIINYKLISNISLDFESNSKLSYLRANLSLLPQNNVMQQVISLKSYALPDTNIYNQENSIFYEWKSLDELYKYGVDSQVKTFSIVHKIGHIDFPILDLDPSFSKYLEAENIIDLNGEIIDQTNRLVQGESDLFEVVFNVAEWVRTNIKYDLNTLTEAASQKSSWVLENKEGVCDEITSLFISMLRAAGIPARFVTGMVYTNLDYNFGNHGWAEVYFPGYGWVPFDVTFGEYGWINPGHIKLSSSLDAGEASITYTWQAYNINVNPSELSLSAEVTEVGNVLGKIYDIEIEPMFDRVGEGSYVPLRVTVENPSNSYVANSLTVVKAPELTEENNKVILLRPYEKKDIFWIIRAPSNLEKGYTYTSLIEVTDLFGTRDRSQIEYSQIYDQVTLEEAKEKISTYEVLETKNFSREINLKCNSDRLYYKVGDTVNIKCNVRNIGNTRISDLSICVENNCNTSELSIAQQADFEFNFVVQNLERKLFHVVAGSEEVKLVNVVSVDVYKEGPLDIKFLDIPESVDYNEIFTIVLELDSDYDINNVDIIINNKKLRNLDKISRSTKIELSLRGKEISEQGFSYRIVYNDEYGEQYYANGVLPINVEKIPWYVRLTSFLRNLISFK